MKIKDNLLIREIAGTWIVVPIGQRVIEFNGLMTLNEIGVFIWKKLERETTVAELTKSVTDEYNIDEQTAINDIEEFIAKLIEKDLID